MQFRLLPVILIGVLCVIGCKKDKDDPAPAPGGGNPVPAGAANGEMLAYKQSFTNVGGTTTSFGYAIAYFTHANQRVSVGEVTCNGSNIGWDDEEDGYEGGISMAQNTYTWSVEGGNGWPAFTTNGGGATRPVISGGVTSSSQIDLANSYTYTVGGVAGADSVFFYLAGVTRKFAGNVSSATFTSAELQSVQGQMQTVGEVVARKRVRQTHGGKTVDLVLEEVSFFVFTL